MKKTILIIAASIFLFISGCTKGGFRLDTTVMEAKNTATRFTITVPTAPTLPLAPTGIPTRIYSVSSYGPNPNDGVDDRPAIQSAIDALQTAGGGTLQFPAGTYDISINPNSDPTYKFAFDFRTYSKIKLAPVNGASVTLKLKNNQGDYATIFNLQNSSDILLTNLIFDQNGLNNQIPFSRILDPSTGAPSSEGGSVADYATRKILDFSAASRFKVTNCTFNNVMGVWVIVDFTGADATITYNSFNNVGGATHDYDVSVVYSDCDRALVDHNTITARNEATRGARTAIETHGNDQTISNNTINKMAVGVNVTGGTDLGSTTVSRQSYTGNIMNNVYNGFEFWTNKPLNSVLIDNNKVYIDLDPFIYASPSLPGFVAGQYAAPFGIGIKDWYSAVTTVKISNNTFSFNNLSTNLQEVNFSAGTYAAGISLAPVDFAFTTVSIANLTVTGNSVLNSLSAGFYSTVSLNSALIDSNSFMNPGLEGFYSGPTRYSDAYWDAFTSQYQSGVYCRSKQNSKVQGVVISKNTVNDSFTPPDPDIVEFGAVGATTTLGTGCSISGTVVNGASGAVVQSKGTGWN